MRAFKLDELLAVYDLEGITLQELVKVVKDAMQNAVKYDKSGAEIGPDHALRMDAVKLLADLAQLPLMGKFSAMKKVKEGEEKQTDVIAAVKQKVIEAQATKEGTA